MFGTSYPRASRAGGSESRAGCVGASGAANSGERLYAHDILYQKCSPGPAGSSVMVRYRSGGCSNLSAVVGGSCARPTPQAGLLSACGSCRRLELAREGQRAPNVAVAAGSRVHALLSLMHAAERPSAEAMLDAVGDHLRCLILLRLRDAPKPVVELGRGFPVSRPAVSQHLRVLRTPVWSRAVLRPRLMNRAWTSHGRSMDGGAVDLPQSEPDAGALGPLHPPGCRREDGQSPPVTAIPTRRRDLCLDGAVESWWIDLCLPARSGLVGLAALHGWRGTIIDGIDCLQPLLQPPAHPDRVVVPGGGGGRR